MEWLKIKIKETHKDRLKDIDFKKQAEKLKAANPELPQPQKDAE